MTKHFSLPSGAPAGTVFKLSANHGEHEWVIHASGNPYIPADADLLSEKTESQQDKK